MAKASASGAMPPHPEHEGPFSPEAEESGWRTRFDPEFAYRASQQVLPILERYFRVQYEGLHYLADLPAFLAVAIHGGGMLTPDSYIWAGKYHSLRRKPYMLTLSHNLIAGYAEQPMGRFLAKGGMIRASFESALAALQAGYALTVYPGGDHDPYRNFTHRHVVNFHGRKGYIKLALKAGVPLLPWVSTGAHETLFVLWDGAPLARFFELDRRFAVHTLPLVLKAPWGLDFGQLPHLPLPAQITLRVLPPIHLTGFGPEDADNPAALQAIDQEVQRRMQAALTDLGSGRIPLLGKPADWRRQQRRLLRDLSRLRFT